MEVKLVIVGGKLAGREIPIRTREFLIGRGQECQLRPQSNAISRKHCAIVVGTAEAAIEDYNSTNGTYVNGERVDKRRELKSGDRIKVGMLELDVLLAVSVGGVTKPKVHNVHEAAARTVASAAASGDDLDISSWLEKGDNEDNETVTWPIKKPEADDDTLTGKGLTENTTVAGPPAKKGGKAKEKTPPKPVGQFQRKAKPMAESSGEAASDMLKQFFSRKR